MSNLRKRAEEAACVLEDTHQISAENMGERHDVNTTKGEAMDINNLTLGQIKEVAQVASGLGPCARPAVSADESPRIVVLQRGWVVVGLYSRQGDEITVRNAHVIRRWGTSDGVGQLAESGPLPETKLDKCKRPVRAHRGAEIFTVDCSPEKWAAVLA